MDGSRSDPTSVAARDNDWLQQPLGLTVHSLPDPGGRPAPGQAAASAGRRTMALILLVCAAPVLLSTLLYFGVRPQGRSNYGTLIEPLRPIPSVLAYDLQQRATSLANLRGHWLLVSVADARCDARCESHLLLQRQLRESLGKDKDRVVWVWLMVGDATARPELLPGLREATVLRVGRAELSRWLEPEAGAALEDHLYVVDPQGHWMLRFPAELDVTRAARARRDLDRLLRASAPWDKPVNRVLP